MKDHIWQKIACKQQTNGNLWNYPPICQCSSLTATCSIHPIYPSTHANMHCMEGHVYFHICHHVLFHWLFHVLSHVLFRVLFHEELVILTIPGWQQRSSGPELITIWRLWIFISDTITTLLPRPSTKSVLLLPSTESPTAWSKKTIGWSGRSRN